MLDISSHITEYEIGVDYAEIYRNSSLYRYAQYYSHKAANYFILAAINNKVEVNLMEFLVAPAGRTGF